MSIEIEKGLAGLVRSRGTNAFKRRAAGSAKKQVPRKTRIAVKYNVGQIFDIGPDGVWKIIKLIITEF